jgi:hypothetical protein
LGHPFEHALADELRGPAAVEHQNRAAALIALDFHPPRAGDVLERYASHVLRFLSEDGESQRKREKKDCCAFHDVVLLVHDEVQRAAKKVGQSRQTRNA